MAKTETGSVILPLSYKWGRLCTNSDFIASTAGILNSYSGATDGKEDTYAYFADSLFNNDKSSPSLSEVNAWHLLCYGIEGQRVTLPSSSYGRFPIGANITQLQIQYKVNIQRTGITRKHYSSFDIPKLIYRSDIGSSSSYAPENGHYGKPTDSAETGSNKDDWNTKTISLSEVNAFTIGSLNKTAIECLEYPADGSSASTYQLRFIMRLAVKYNSAPSENQNKALYEIRAKLYYSLPYWDINVSATTGGTVTGAEENLKNRSSHTVNATANDGYEFVGWEENGQIISTSANYAIEKVERSYNLMAKFKKVGGADVYLGTSKIAENVQSVYIGGNKIY